MRCPTSLSPWHDASAPGLGLVVGGQASDPRRIPPGVHQGGEETVRRGHLDLFTGSYDNQRRHGPGTFPGSARIALENEPPFTRLAFFELPEPAARLEAAISAARPDDRRWRVFPGDCNVTLPSALEWLNDVRWAPTFAFLDPRGLQVAWTTIETLAHWRADRKTKVEQWILLPEPALARVLGLRGARGQRSAVRLDRLYGTKDWIAIHQLRRHDLITPDEMRAEFVNLLRWRLEQHLRYQTTHALQIVNTSGVARLHARLRHRLGARRPDHGACLRLNRHADDSNDASARSCKGHRHRGSTTGLRSQGCMVIPAGPGGGVENRSEGGP